MSDRVTHLLEKAMSSDSDAERIACLNQAAKIYKGSEVAMPRRVRIQDELTVDAKTVTLAYHESVVKDLEKARDQLFRENQTLSAENTQLRADKLAAATAADDVILADIKKKIRGVVLFGAAGWLTAVALVVLGVVLL
jgi:hypothetical protein